MQRWYFGGEQADKEIKKLFGAQLEHMLDSPGDPAWEVSAVEGPSQGIKEGEEASNKGSPRNTATGLCLPDA